MLAQKHGQDCSWRGQAQPAPRAALHAAPGTCRAHFVPSLAPGQQGSVQNSGQKRCSLKTLSDSPTSAPQEQSSRHLQLPRITKLRKGCYIVHPAIGEHPILAKQLSLSTAGRKKRSHLSVLHNTAAASKAMFT